MANFIADKIIEGRWAYSEIFGYKIYQKWKKKVAEILTEKGRADLIEK